MHVSSLPGKRGIGALGKAAYDFVDFAEKSGLGLWQVLPLCPTSYGDSPYQSPSALAGNPYFIDLDTLAEDKLLDERELPVYENTGKVDYAALYNERYATLRKAFSRFIKTPPSDYADFKQKNSFWLDDYALFMSIKSDNGMRVWYEWEDGYKYRTADMSKYAGAAEFWKFLQYEFFKQWAALKEYANGKGIKIVGDMPLYVAYDSVDVWSDPRQFLLNADLSEKSVAGVPPDYFSADGQLWGNPIYDWKYMKERGYDWWLTRIRAAFDMYDIVRIDHFRAFADYYVIEAGRADAKVGEWKDGPGMEFFDVVNSALDCPPIIAEDLGELHDCVRALVRQTGFPGMKILQFAFNGDPKNEFLCDNYDENCVAYTGTHDNNTTRGWFGSLDAGGKQLVRETMGCDELDNITSVFIDRLMASKANTVVIPMQDFLDLPGTARMNEPSTLGGNWTWRVSDVPSRLAQDIHRIVKKYDRL